MSESERFFRRSAYLDNTAREQTLLARIRSGELTEKRVGAAAFLGNPDAQNALVKEPTNKRPLSEEWNKEFAQQSKEGVARALIEMGRTMLAEIEAQEVLTPNQIRSIKRRISLVEKHLVDSNSVSLEDLEDAQRDAFDKMYGTVQAYLDIVTPPIYQCIDVDWSILEAYIGLIGEDGHQPPADALYSFHARLAHLPQFNHNSELILQTYAPAVISWGMGEEDIVKERVEAME